jgi:hypothetical protein
MSSRLSHLDSPDRLSAARERPAEIACPLKRMQQTGWFTEERV